MCCARLRRASGRLTLAAWAPECNPLLDRGALVRPPDRGAASPARPAGPAVDPGLLTASRIARGDLADPFLIGFQHPLGQLDEFGHRGDLGGRAPWVHATEEERLGLVQIADPGQVALIHDRLSDRAFRARGQPPDRLLRVPVGPEQVWAEVADGPRLAAGPEDFHDAELLPHGLE